MLRQALALSLLWASLVGLAACGGTAPAAEPGQGNAPDAVAAAARATADSRFRVALDVPLDLPGGELLVQAEGAFDFAAGRGELVVDPESYARLLDARISPGIWDRLVVQPGAFFTHHPDLGSLLVPEYAEALAGRSWARWTSEPPLYGLPDPATALMWLTERTSAVDDLGAATVDGDETRHYAVTFDPQRFGTTNLRSAKADVWVDSAGLIRQLGVELSYDQGEGVPAYVERGTLRLWEPGVAVSVDAPPPGAILPGEGLELGSSETFASASSG